MIMSCAEVSGTTEMSVCDNDLSCLTTRGASEGLEREGCWAVKYRITVDCVRAVNNLAISLVPILLFRTW